MEKSGVVAFAFGVPDTISSNQRIALIASWRARELHAPIYTQADVRVAPGIEVEYTEEEPGNPPPTLRIARRAVEWAKRQGLKHLWIVAAGPHLWRVLRDTKKAVREAGEKIDVRVCKEIGLYTENSWFCPDSTQERVRSWAAWNKRELILRLMPFFVYRRVAS